MVSSYTDMWSGIHPNGHTPKPRPRQRKEAVRFQKHRGQKKEQRQEVQRQKLVPEETSSERRPAGLWFQPVLGMKRGYRQLMAEQRCACFTFKQTDGWIHGEKGRTRGLRSVTQATAMLVCYTNIEENRKLDQLEQQSQPSNRGHWCCFCILCLVWFGPTQKFRAPVLRDYSWWCCKDHLKYQGDQTRGSWVQVGALSSALLFNLLILLEGVWSIGIRLQSQTDVALLPRDRPTFSFLLSQKSMNRAPHSKGTDRGRLTAAMTTTEMMVTETHNLPKGT